MPTDYRPTVFLPKTDFPMRGDLPNREPPILARWEEMDLYRRLRETSRVRLPITGNSIVPSTRLWLARICSTSVEPARGIPTMKIGVGERDSGAAQFPTVRAVKTADRRRTSRVSLAGS